MITKSTLFVLFSRVAVTKKARDCFHCSNIISNVRSCSDGLRKKLKTKRDKVDACCSSIKSSSRLFCTLKVSLLETPQISPIIIRKKNCFILLGFRHLRPTSQLLFQLQEFCSHNLYFEKNSLSFYLPCQKDISERLKFADSVFRISKSQTSISFWKISLIKQFKLIEPSCCEKYY